MSIAMLRPLRTSSATGRTPVWANQPPRLTAAAACANDVCEAFAVEPAEAEPFLVGDPARRNGGRCARTLRRSVETAHIIAD